MKPEKKAQRHGKRTKNIYQTIILPILLNSGDLFGHTEKPPPFHLSPKRIRKLQVRAAQWTQGLNALQSLCGALLKPDVTTQAVVVMSDLGRSFIMNRSLKCMEIPSQRNQEDEQRLHFVFLQAKSKCENSHFSQVAPKNECSECP